MQIWRQNGHKHGIWRIHSPVSSYDLVCKIWVWHAYEGFFKCQFLNFKPKSKWKKIELILEKGFIFAPRKFFKQNFR